MDSLSEAASGNHRLWYGRHRTPSETASDEAGNLCSEGPINSQAGGSAGHIQTRATHTCTQTCLPRGKIRADEWSVAQHITGDKQISGMCRD